MSNSGARRILLVDNNALLALEEQAMLENRGYEVVPVHSGEKAVDMVRDDPEVDLVLIDLDLGSGIAGDVAAKRLLAMRELPILFLTSHTEKEYVDRVKAITRYGYVLKNSGEFVLWDSIEVAFELFQANRQKELLLREVLHRTKNNMSTIASMLTLQAEMVRETTAKEALEDARNRVHSMQLLYEKLHTPEEIGEMSIRDYLPPLAYDIVDLFPPAKNVMVNTEIEEFTLPAKKLSALGIIANELITNAMKYAFEGRDDGMITVAGQKRGDEVTIVVEDNGNGMPDLSGVEGFGFSLVDSLVQQLNGELIVEHDGGTRFILTFPG